jgi:dienelactone hydrolase
MKTANVNPASVWEEEVSIPAGNGIVLPGRLDLPRGAQGIVLFAHGSGSSHHSPRNQFVARVMREAGMGTLLFDLLTQEEETEDEVTREFRFDIDLLAKRLLAATKWSQRNTCTRGLRIGYFGASTGAGAALLAAAKMPDAVDAVVSRGGRPDLAGEALSRVRAPTLLIVGGYDDVVIGLNEEALAKLRCEKEIRSIFGATHLFEEPGTLEQVAQLSTAWFERHIKSNQKG